MDCYSFFRDRLILDDSQRAVIAILSVPLIPVTIFTNVAVIVSLVKTKQLHRNQSNWFIFALSVSDCLLGSFTLPGFAILFTILSTTRNCILEQAIQFMVNFNGHVSGAIIIAIAFDRSLNLDPDLQRVDGLGQWMKTTGGFRISMCICFLFSFIMSVMATIDYKDRQIPDSISGAVYFFLFFLMCVLYYRLHKKIRCFAKRVQDMKLYSNQTDRPVYLKRVTRTVLFLLSSIGFCYLPFFIVNIIWTVVSGGATLKLVRFAYYLTLVILFFNSTINALIILYRNKTLFQFIISKLFCCKTGIQPNLNQIVVKHITEDIEMKTTEKGKKLSDKNVEKIIVSIEDGAVNSYDNISGNMEDGDS